MTLPIDAAFTLLTHAGILLAACAIAALLPGAGQRWRWIALAVGALVLWDVVATLGFRLVPDPLAGARWNWTGKLAAFAVLLILAVRLGPARAGLRLRQDGGVRFPLIVMAIGLAPLVLPDLADGAQPSDAETIAFQLIVPGLDEELLFRGILLLALNEAFARRVSVAGAPIGWGGLVTCVMFGVVHGCAWEAGRFDLGLEAMLWSGGPSLLLLWLRERTGSLLLPVLAHNLANGLPNLY